MLSPDEQPEETVHKLAAVLRSIDELGALGSATLDLEEIAAIDRRVKACRAVLSETSRKAAKGKPSGKSGTKVGRPWISVRVGCRKVLTGFLTMAGSTDVCQPAATCTFVQEAIAAKA